MTAVELNPSIDYLESLADRLLAAEPAERAEFILGLTPGHRALVRRALAVKRDPLGTRVYRQLGYEPICIPRVTAALEAGYSNPMEAEQAGMEDLPAPCGECPAERFDAALEFDVLFGGAAGGSKTKSSLMMGIRCMARWPGFRALLLRETYDELDENVYPELRAIDYAEAIGGKWNAGRRQLDIGKSSMRFRYMADLSDVLRRRGGSYQLIILDERNQLPSGTADNLQDRLRSANPKIPVIGFRSTANPGGQSHGELKAGYVKPDPTLESRTTPAGDVITRVKRGTAEFERRFIPAKATDNPYLGDDYYETVLGGIEDPILRAAMRDGDWDVFAGQYFGEWRDARHVVPRNAVTIAATWRRYAGIDYGRAAPFCYLRGAVDNDGRVWLYAELYKTGLDESVQAKMILENERRHGETDTLRAGDASMWSKTSENPSIADTYERVGVKMEPADSKPGSRVIGWARVHSFLSDGVTVRDGEEVGAPCAYHASMGWESCPMLHVLEGTCPNLVRTLPDLPFDKNRVEDLDTSTEDHAADALRYLLMQIKPPRRRRRRRASAMQRQAAASTA